VLEAVLAQPALDRSAGTEDIGRGGAAIEDDPARAHAGSVDGLAPGSP
jgi:hypothetical protein